MSKVKQKVAGCFRTFEFAEALRQNLPFPAIHGQKGYNSPVAIQIALAGNAAHILSTGE